jgi:hypothetical protein
MRDMLRPKSDPRRKPRSNSLQRQRQEEQRKRNPLDEFFASQISVLPLAPSPKDNLAQSNSDSTSKLAKRPLTRRLQRHRQLSDRRLKEILRNNSSSDGQDSKLDLFHKSDSVLAFDLESYQNSNKTYY